MRYIICLIPLYLYGFYKNGIKLYALGLVNIFGLFKPLIFDILGLVIGMLVPFIVDNYIGLKTLVLLKTVKPNVQVTLFSDSVGKGLHRTELLDFCKEYPNVHINLKKTNGIYHDRYIFIDFGSTDEKIYHCGGSSKDGGIRTTAISQVEDTSIYKIIAKDLQKNPILIL